MDMQGVSFIGWVHSVACTIALIAGGWSIFAAKGTGPHKLRGHIYAWSMIVANVLVFFIYRFDLDLAHGFKPGAGIFGLFHWFAVFALAFTLVGYYASSRQAKGFWAYVHPVAMLLSYYLLFGGLVNELFARVDVLRPFAAATKNTRAFGGIAIAMAQNAVLLMTLLLIVWFVVKVARYRRQVRRTIAQPG